MEQEASQAGDADVQRLITQGNYRPALEALVRRYQHLIVRYCVTMLGEAGSGEEVAQEVFLAAYRAMPHFRREAMLRTWLWAIARKQCLKALRDSRRRRWVETEQRSAIVSGVHRALPDPAAEDPEVLLLRVRQGLDRLAAAERTVRSCTSIVRVTPQPENQVQCPHITTVWEGLCHGIAPVFLPADAAGTPVALHHAALYLVKRASRRGSEAIPASAAAAQALQRLEAISWPHPPAPLCRL
jgi:RNA polymerase sigma factor (sigma-70 family)